MLGLYGYESAVQNIYLASAATLGERAVDSLNGLRGFYLDALAKLAPTLPICRSETKFVSDPELEQQLVGFFKPSSLDDLRQHEVIGDSYPSQVRRDKIARVSTALERLFSESFSFARIFDLFVHSVLVRDAKNVGEKTPRGGTTSLAPGVIWVAAHDWESEEDIMEIFVHELTHLMMFTDELVNKQFHYSEIKKKANFSRSAILQGIRPLDKVVHSIVVGTEIILARETLLSSSHEKSGAHPSSETLAAGVRSAFKGVRELQSATNIITPHTREMIERCANECRNYETARVA